MAKRKLNDLLKQDKSVKPKSVPINALGVPAGALKLAALGTSVRAKVGKTSNMAEIELCLFNDGKKDAVVELTGTVLHPSSTSFQRLFVAGNHEIPKPMVTIPAGKEVKVRLATCCMDQSRSSPAKTVTYRITDAAPRDIDVQAARNWMTARQILDGSFRTSDIDTGSYALQGNFRGSRARVEPPMTREVAQKKAVLHYVQDVCWNQGEL